MKKIFLFQPTHIFCLGIIIFVHISYSQAEDSSPKKLDVAARLMQNVPADFPRFEFADHDEQAQLLNHYLWYHFHNRLGNGLTLFNKEYLLTSDIWLGNAYPRGSKQRIQDVHHDLLLKIQLDGEGYVMTHQHFSHAHDHGWPFPSCPSERQNRRLALSTTEKRARLDWRTSPCRE